MSQSTQETESGNPTVEQFSAVWPAFFEELRCSGFQVDIEHFVRVNELLIHIASGLLLNPSAKLKSLIAPSSVAHKLSSMSLVYDSTPGLVAPMRKTVNRSLIQIYREQKRYLQSFEN